MPASTCKTGTMITAPVLQMGKLRFGGGCPLFGSHTWCVQSQLEEGRRSRWRGQREQQCWQGKSLGAEGEEGPLWGGLAWPEQGAQASLGTGVQEAIEGGWQGGSWSGGLFR